MPGRSTALLAALLALAAGALAGDLHPHTPIVIASDVDFTPENGVVGGSGTPEDPYIIAGWEIDAGSGTGIAIRDTSAHFVIRDCRVTGTPRDTGIALVEIRGGAVEGCTLEGLGIGLFVYRSEEVRVSGSTFARCRRGLEGTESPRLVVRGNGFLEPKKEGIFLWHSHDALIEGNRFRGGVTAIYLDSCHRDRLRENLVEGTEQGLFLWDSFDCVIAENLVRDCGLGVALVHTSAGNAVFHNAFLGCERPAACDGPGNRWDGGYPTGGNYWGGVPLEDRFSGPDQDEPGPDGIGDEPVEVPLGCADRYPLVALPEVLTRWEGGK